jgi:hypothetical protein
MSARVVKERWLGAAFLFLLIAGTALPAMAGTISLFGPNQYVRTEGNPNTFASTFRLPANVTDCRLVISYGPGGPLSANSVSVTVNGKEMNKAKSDATNSAVELRNENTVFVTLKGKPGDSIVVQVLGQQQENQPGTPQEPPPVMVNW